MRRRSTIRNEEKPKLYQYRAVNHQQPGYDFLGITCGSPRDDFPSCVASRSVIRPKDTPRSLVEPVSGHGSRGSSHRSRFSDEPFRVRDVQFDDPGILVEPCALSEEFVDFDGTGRFGGPRFTPAIRSVRAKDSFKAANVAASAGDNQQDRTAVGIAAFDDRCEVAGGGDSPNQARNFNLRWQPAAAHPLRRRRARRRSSARRRARRGFARRASSRASPRCALPG